MATREVVTKKALCEWMTAEMRKHKGCEGCRVDGVYRLQEPDADGCNWSPGHYNMGGAPEQVAGPVAREVFAAARAKFNLINEPTLWH